jgi:hypothetical protein
MEGPVEIRPQTRRNQGMRRSWSRAGEQLSQNELGYQVARYRHEILVGGAAYGDFSHEASILAVRIADAIGACWVGSVLPHRSKVRRAIPGSADGILARSLSRGLSSSHPRLRYPRQLPPDGSFRYPAAVSQNCRSGELCPTGERGSLAGAGAQHKRLARASKPSTSTLNANGQTVPWLAAVGPLAYSPEAPPARDYYFQYNRILPGIFADHVNLRRRLYFGGAYKENVREVLAFWETARQGKVNRAAFCLGESGATTVTAPLAVYRAVSPWRDEVFVFIQHGSYQIVRVAEQPLLESGEVLLYRGLQNATEFRRLRLGTLDSTKQETWTRYHSVQAHVLSDSERSFNSIHDRARRSETVHIRDGSWVTDDLARQHGLDPKDGGFTQALWTDTHQSFALERWVAENKFGPNYVVCKTPLGNIRITTSFAGEREARIVDPGRVDVIETHGCRVEEYNG